MIIVTPCMSALDTQYKERANFSLPLSPLCVLPLFGRVSGCVPSCGEGQHPCPSRRFRASLGPLFRQCRDCLFPPPPGRFPRDERSSRRKNRRFCGAGSLTTARGAGSCGVLKGRCSVHGIVAMTPFSVKFSCLLRAAKSRRGVPGLLWHEYRPQELRCLNKYRPASPQGSRQKL